MDHQTVNKNQSSVWGDLQAQFWQRAHLIRIIHIAKSIKNYQVTIADNVNTKSRVLLLFDSLKAETKIMFKNMIVVDFP